MVVHGEEYACIEFKWPEIGEFLRRVRGTDQIHNSLLGRASFQGLEQMH